MRGLTLLAGGSGFAPLMVARHCGADDANVLGLRAPGPGGLCSCDDEFGSQSGQFAHKFAQVERGTGPAPFGLDLRQAT